jgi:precorrin-4/cobalt-precorrin-4 C11-methyltransferase
MTEPGLVSFVGAGPGAPDLLTVRALERLRRADVVVWASSLVPRAVVELAGPGAEILDSASMTLEDTLDLFANRPTSRIVRLHSGDPSLYGAIAEQLRWCREQGRPVEIVPGVSSVHAAAAAAEVELTVPGLSQSLVVTRLPGRTGASVPPSESVRAWARLRPTMAVLLAGARAEELRRELLADGEGYPPETPVVVVARASWPDERLVRASLDDLPAAMAATGRTTTVLVLVGDALDATRGGRSHLYDPRFAHRFRRRSAPGSSEGRPGSRRLAADGGRPVGLDAFGTTDLPGGPQRPG